MNISDSLLKTLKCCLSIDDSHSHIVKDAHILSCGGNACKQCLDLINGNLQSIKCKYCLQTHTLLESKYENPIVNNLIETFSNDLIEIVRKDFNESLTCIDELEKRLNEDTDQIEHEIDNKMNLLKKRIDELGEELKSELTNIRVSWKKSLPSEIIENLNGKFQDKCQNFYEIQEKTIELRESVTKCLEKLNSIKFVTNVDKELDKRIIGEFQAINTSTLIIDNSSSQTLKQVLTSDTQVQVTPAKSSRVQIFDIGSETLYRCTLFNNQIVLTDFKGKKFKEINKTGELISSHNPNNLLSEPLAICSSIKKNQLFIGDCAKNEIYVIDSNYELVRSFPSIIRSPNCMTIDDDSCLLYVTDWNNNLLCVYDINTFKLIKSSTIDSPMHIKLCTVNNKSLLILSAISFEKTNNDKLEAITKGSNCIFEVCKENLTILNTISAENWFHPRGLDCNHNGIILTTALLLDDNNFISSNRYLFIINQKDLMLNSIELNIANVSDLVYYDKKILTCYQKEITIHEFEELNDI